MCFNHTCTALLHVFLEVFLHSRIIGACPVTTDWASGVELICKKQQNNKMIPVITAARSKRMEDHTGRDSSANTPPGVRLANVPVTFHRLIRPMLMETLYKPNKQFFKDTCHNIPVPRAMSTNNHIRVDIFWYKKIRKKTIPGGILGQLRPKKN